MKYLFTTTLALIPFLLFSQQFCGYFLPDIEYSGNSAPDLRIEYHFDQSDKKIIFFPSKNDQPLKLGEDIGIELFFNNRTRKNYSLNDMKIQYFEDPLGKEQIGYVHPVSTIESIQLKSGIAALIYLEAPPGDIIRYNFIGKCD
jgi:hypothetical protein